MKTSPKKNLNAVIVPLVGLGILGFVFRKQIKNLFNKNSSTLNPEELPEETSSNPTPGTNNETTKNPLSPIGTPKDKLKFDVSLKLGDSGQEVAKLQQILNKISSINGGDKIKEDGNFGVATQSKLKKTYGTASINLRNAYYMLYAIWQSKQNGEPKKWFDKYFKPYSKADTRLESARANYFKNNLPI